VITRVPPGAQVADEGANVPPIHLNANCYLAGRPNHISDTAAQGAEVRGGSSSKGGHKQLVGEVDGSPSGGGARAEEGKDRVDNAPSCAGAAAPAVSPEALEISSAPTSEALAATCRSRNLSPALCRSHGDASALIFFEFSFHPPTFSCIYLSSSPMFACIPKSKSRHVSPV